MGAVGADVEQGLVMEPRAVKLSAAAAAVAAVAGKCRLWSHWTGSCVFFLAKGPKWAEEPGLVQHTQPGHLLLGCHSPPLPV